jgi:hypothetical protein
MNTIFFRPIGASVRNGSAATVNDAISALFDSFRV